MISLFRTDHWRDAMRLDLDSKVVLLVPSKNIHQLNIDSLGGCYNTRYISILNPLDIIILDEVQASVFKDTDNVFVDDAVYNIITYGSGRFIRQQCSNVRKNKKGFFYIKKILGKDIKGEDYQIIRYVKKFQHLVPKTNTFDLLSHLKMSKRLMELVIHENNFKVIFNQAETILSNDAGRVIIFGDNELGFNIPSTHYLVDAGEKLDIMVSSMVGIDFNNVDAFKRANTFIYNIFYPKSKNYLLFINDDGDLDIRAINGSYEDFLMMGRDTDVGTITVCSTSKEIIFDFINIADTLFKVGKKTAVIDVNQKDTCKSDLVKILIEHLGGENYTDGVAGYFVYYHNSASGTINDGNLKNVGEYFLLEKGVQQLETLLELHLVKEAFNQQILEV